MIAVCYLELIEAPTTSILGWRSGSLRNLLYGTDTRSYGAVLELGQFSSMQLHDIKSSCAPNSSLLTNGVVSSALFKIRKDKAKLHYVQIVFSL